jgi:adenosylmethionine-8-amino-7-oxononanoate aminotransferase
VLPIPTGLSYTGNPLACAAALANLHLFHDERTLTQLQPKISRLAEGLRPLADHPHVGEIRQCGFLVGIELVADRATRARYEEGLRIGHRVILEARGRGAILRPLGDVVILNPPLSIEASELDRLVDITRESIRIATA